MKNRISWNEEMGFLEWNPPLNDAEYAAMEKASAARAGDVLDMVIRHLSEQDSACSEWAVQAVKEMTID